MATPPSALSIATLQNMTTEFESFKRSYNNAGSALAQVINTGTVIYNDANFASEFPTSWAAYQAYLVKLQSAINTFIAGLPVEPPLNG